jgi:hypothetical protein
MKVCVAEASITKIDINAGGLRHKVFGLQTSGCVSFVQFLAWIVGFSPGAKVCGLLRFARENFFDVDFNGDAAGLGALGQLFPERLW